jgi:putative NIF3 family GTP cyclohydrolase 1 type 2
VTGELSWHRQLEAMEAGAAVIMLGHEESEGPFVPATIEGLKRASGRNRWGLEAAGFERSGGERRGA